MGKDPGYLKLYFLKADGSAYQPRRGVQNRDPSSTLKHIQAKGCADGFYKGSVAELAGGGHPGRRRIITLEDLAAYRANVLEPIWSDYRGHASPTCRRPRRPPAWPR